MRTRLFLSIAFLGLVAGSQAAYAACGTGNNSTSASFCNTNTLTIENNANGPTQGSAFAITASGMSGAVSSVSVTLNGYTVGSGSVPEDAMLMLVAPSGQALIFFGGDCGSGGADPNGANITFSDSGSGFPPVFNYNAQCISTTYKPYVDESVLGQCDGFYTSPAPTNAACANNPSGSNTFTSVFTGVTPNGTWTIYSYDVSGSDVQSITSGITLTLTTEITQSATTTSVSVNPIEIFNNSPGNASTFTATVTSGGNNVNEGEVQFYDNGATAGTPVAVSGGVAQLNDIYGPATPEGLHLITATYTDNASSPTYETSNNNSNPTDLFIDNHTTVSNNGMTFCNSGTITISGTGNEYTTPYPQHVFVNGLSGTLAGVTLTLNDINEVNGLVDWKALLVGPDGTSFAPMVFAGGYGNASGLTINLSDNGSGLLAVGTSDTAPANNGTYLPTAYNTFTWPTQNNVPFAPPQSGYLYPQTKGSATFAGTFASENINNPTQPWSLYLSDEAGDSDTVGGYCLTFTTNTGVATATSVNASPNPDITNTQVTLTATVTANSGATPVTSGSVKFEQQGNPTPLGTASLNGSGQASINFTPSSEGQYVITALYGGDSGTYNSSQGSTTLQVDNQTTVNGTSFCNPGPITITASTDHTPQQYPSRVLVSNVAGVVSGVTLTLDSLTYSFPLDLAMMVTGPNGGNIAFWGNVGGDNAINNQNFVISDSAGSALPSGSSPPSGTYLPTAYATPVTLSFAPPAPASPNFAAPDGSTTLTSQFQNTNPNGYWSFFAEEETAGGDTGSIGQHCVNLTITPPALAITKSHSGSFTQGDTADTYTIMVSNNGPGSTVGSLDLADTIPTGMTGVGMSETGHSGGGTGSDWTCSPTTASCSRTTAMPSGEIDTITLTVSVSYSTPTGTNSVTNSVNVSGGGASNSPTASDQTTINIGPGYVLSTSVNPSASGTVTANPTNSVGMPAGHYVPGTVVTLTANPAVGYTFSSWSGSADLSSTTANPTTITMNSATESVTANFSLIVVATPTTTSVSSSNNPSFTTAPGNSVTFTATVTSNSTVNEGTVTFSDPAGDFTCSGGNTVAVSNGTATCTTSFTTEGSRNITAGYSGTINFQTSSGFVTQGVNNHTVQNGNQFCNQGPIAVPSTAGAATPYPSNIFVTGLGGNVGAVTVNLNNISSSNIQQTDLLLVGPTGAQIIPFASVGDGSAIAGVNVVLDDAASSLIPGGSPLVNGSYKPTSITGSTSLVFPAPAPVVSAGNYAATDGTATLASTFQNTAPNGTWALYAMDNAGNGAANIGGGWCVNISPATVQTTITTSPAGLLVSVDGGTATAAPLVENWIAGSSHTIATSSPQAGGTGVQYVWSNWSDAGAVSHSITVPPTPTTYTASFNTQYQLTTQASPSADGTVAPASGGYYASGASIPVTATANAVFTFSNWTSTGGTFDSNISASTNFHMPAAPATVTGNFANSRVQITISTSPANLLVSVDGGTTTAAPLVETWVIGSSHTIATSSPQSGGAGVQYVWSKWSDSGLISHSITVPPTATTYTASFSTSYLLTTTANPSSEGTVSPASGNFYPSGTVVLLTATPNSGYMFKNWTGHVANSTSASTTITLTAPQSATANFSGIPEASLSPSPVAFGTVYLNRVHSKVVTLTNGGTGTLDISNISLTSTGGNPSAFELTKNCGATLAPGKACSITIGLTPSTIGTDTATLNVADNASGSPQHVSVSATVINPQAALSPQSENFGTHKVGVRTAGRTVTLTNNGTTALTIDSIAITGTDLHDFAQSHTCGSLLSPGHSCTISVTFDAQAKGTRSAGLTITDNAFVGTETISLSGTGD
jgi:hypothetical protein